MGHYNSADLSGVNDDDAICLSLLSLFDDDFFAAFLFDLEVRRAQRKGRFMQEEMRGHLGRKFIEELQLHQEKEKAFLQGLLQSSSESHF